MIEALTISDKERGHIIDGVLVLRCNKGFIARDESGNYFGLTKHEAVANLKARQLHKD